MKKNLLVLGCSQTKRDTSGLLPAIDRYDGSSYRVLRSFLRKKNWPKDLSIAVLSAKYGLIGGFTGIEDYDERMTSSKAKTLAPYCAKILQDWKPFHSNIYLSLGKDYLPAITEAAENTFQNNTKVFEGPIGMKLNQIKGFLESSNSVEKRKAKLPEPGSGNTCYFLPDWDDLLDERFDFYGDSFSGPNRSQRSDKHCSVLMKPKRISDGILVSLAQRQASKGPLRKLTATDSNSLAPIDMRMQFGLDDDQYLFGDCGAFSYVNEEKPTITIDEAIALYDLHGFDFGASVDHMPFLEIKRDGKRVLLSQKEREERVKITIENAAEFITAVKQRKAGFTPVGTIQSLTSAGYANTVRQYHGFGYNHLALGGLVPQSDDQIAEIVVNVMKIVNKLKPRPWIHLFGVFRPKLQDLFRELKVDSFDSATYFRKAWLRSDQNYLAANGKWYAAIRVPMTSDGRTRKKLEESNLNITQLEREEKDVLRVLNLFDKDKARVNEVLDSVLTYDQHLTRSCDLRSMREKYKRTLEDRPWKLCGCPFCKDLGIHIAIFRGLNRNKRRGTHNTLMLYKSVKGLNDNY